MSFRLFVPALTIAANTEPATNKPHWINDKTGLLAEEKTIDETLEEQVDKIILKASEEKAKHEKTGDRELSIFKTGVTLEQKISSWFENIWSQRPLRSHEEHDVERCVRCGALCTL